MTARQPSLFSNPRRPPRQRAKPGANTWTCHTCGEQFTTTAAYERHWHERYGCRYARLDLDITVKD